MRFDYITMVSNLGGNDASLKAVAVDNASSDKAYYPQ